MSMDEEKIDDIFIKTNIDITKPMDGGIFYRAFDLMQFLKKVEKQTGKKVVGIRFDGNNIEIYVGETEGTEET